MNDRCPCGAFVFVESVAPDEHGWEGRCEADHRVYMTDLHSPPVILEEQT